MMKNLPHLLSISILLMMVLQFSFGQSIYENKNDGPLNHHRLKTLTEPNEIGNSLYSPTDEFRLHYLNNWLWSRHDNKLKPYFPSIDGMRTENTSMDENLFSASSEIPYAVKNKLENKNEIHFRSGNFRLDSSYVFNQWSDDPDVIYYTYDEDGRLAEALTSTPFAPQYSRVLYSYDIQGNLDNELHQQNANGWQTRLLFEYEYPSEQPHADTVRAFRWDYPTSSLVLNYIEVFQLNESGLPEIKYNYWRPWWEEEDVFELNIRTLYEYDEANNLLSETNQSNCGISEAGPWNNLTLLTYYYGTENEVIKIDQQYWDYAEWAPATLKVEFTYDGFGNISEENESYFSLTGDESWALRYRDTTIYPTNGMDNTTIASNFDLLTNEWKVAFSVDSIFNEEGLISEIILNTDYCSDSLSPRRKTTFEYNGSNHILQESTFLWNEGSQVWDNDLNTIFTYGDEGLLSEEVQQYWGYPDADMWNNQWRISYSYDSINVLTESVIELWNANTWNKRFRSSYVYDSDGNLTDEFESIWSFLDMDWVFMSKNEYQYNEDEKLSLLLKLRYLNSNDTWFQEAQEEYSYNDQGRLTETVFSTWISNTIGFLAHKKIHKEYDPISGKLILESHEWLGQTEYEWIPSKNIENFWSKQLTNTQDKKLETLDCDFPNPFRSGSSIICETYENNDEYTLSIFDLMGRERISQPFIQQTMLPDALPQGTYFFLIKNENGESLYRKVIFFP